MVEPVVVMVARIVLVVGGGGAETEFSYDERNQPARMYWNWTRLQHKIETNTILKLLCYHAENCQLACLLYKCVQSVAGNFACLAFKYVHLYYLGILVSLFEAIWKRIACIRNETTHIILSSFSIDIYIECINNWNTIKIHMNGAKSVSSPSYVSLLVDERNAARRNTGMW